MSVFNYFDAYKSLKTRSIIVTTQSKVNPYTIMRRVFSLFVTKMFSLADEDFFGASTIFSELSWIAETEVDDVVDFKVEMLDCDELFEGCESRVLSEEESSVSGGEFSVSCEEELLSPELFPSSGGGWAAFTVILLQTSA